MAFTRKQIEVTFTLSPVTDPTGKVSSQPTFAGSSSNSVTLRGYRTSAHIVKAGGASQGEAHLRIYGMSLQLMNQLSTLGRTPVILGKNEIAIAAGEEGQTPALIFKGSITQAYTDLGGAPEGMFHVSAYSMAYQAVQTIAPTSFKGPVDAAVILQGLATQMGLTFENNGVHVILQDPAFNGSAMSQAQKVVEAAHIDWIVDNGILAIWPKGGSRAGTIPVIAPGQGLIGYPYPSGQGLLGLRSVFNPNVNFGAKVQVQSSIAPACGTWTVVHVTHEIESEMPGGQWFTEIVGSPPGYLPLSQ